MQARGCPLVLLEGLRERDVGILAGLTFAEAAQQHPEAWAALRSGSSSQRVPNGESLDELMARVAAVLEAMAARHPGE